MNKIFVPTLVVVLVLFAFNQGTFAQSKSHPWGFGLMAAVGQGHYNMSHAGPSKFPSLEVRVGGSVEYRLADNFFVEGNANFGVRAKREPFNKPGQPYAFGAPFSSLDEVSSSRDHYFYEIPLRLVYLFPHPKIGIKAGMNYRFFFPNNDDVDFLTNRGEFGIIGGLFYRLNHKMNVGVDGYHGLTQIYSSRVQTNGYEADFIIRNQFLQAYIQYQF